MVCKVLEMARNPGSLAHHTTSLTFCQTEIFKGGGLGVRGGGGEQVFNLN